MAAIPWLRFWTTSITKGRCLFFNLSALLFHDYREQNLAQLTTATGGRLYKPDQFSALDAVYREVAEELRHQYALYYKPLNKTKDGRFRRVQVAMSEPALKAATRIGYFAPRK